MKHFVRAKLNSDLRTLNEAFVGRSNRTRKVQHDFDKKIYKKEIHDSKENEKLFSNKSKDDRNRNTELFFFYEDD